MPPALHRSLILACVAMTWLPMAASAFGLQDVAKQAQALAAEAYEPPDKLPAALDRDHLSYDQYRDIRFRPDHALWHGTRLPFEVQLFHRGLYFDRPIRIHVVTADGVRPLRFDADDFDYGKNQLDPKMLAALEGFAGLRVHYPLNTDQYKDELLVFQGASYFRALGQGQRYGLSARGLAIDTGELSGEEFPAFTEFWIEWPRPQDHVLRVYALLDSPRVTGAYAFEVTPGDATRMAVRAELFFRDDVGKLGVAPLTSMYLFGENQPPRTPDYRPEVHDSDGLMIHTGTEWLWRPLVNPRRLMMSSFSVEQPRGFGLMQRDRDFRHYEDLEARYELRPSAWVEPRGDWGKGRIELVTIPTPDETNDNIVAYWVPETSPKAGDHLSFEYDLYWQLHTLTQPPLAHVTQTRIGHGWLKEPDDTQRFHIDFEGEALNELPDDARLSPSVWIGEGGELVEQQAYRNDVTGGWRLSLRVRRTDDSIPLEMRATLTDGSADISETWSYILPATTGRRHGDR